MAMLYWLHRQDELNMFESGYIGVTENLAARMRSHKHKFKKIWEQLKLTVLVIGSSEYLFDIEKQLRPQKMFMDLAVKVKYQLRLLEWINYGKPIRPILKPLPT